MDFAPAERRVLTAVAGSICDSKYRRLPKTLTIEHTSGKSVSIPAVPLACSRMQDTTACSSGDRPQPSEARKRSQRRKDSILVEIRTLVIFPDRAVAKYIDCSSPIGIRFFSEASTSGIAGRIRSETSVADRQTPHESTRIVLRPDLAESEFESSTEYPAPASLFEMMPIWASVIFGSRR